MGERFEHKTIAEASLNVLQMMSNLIHINTLFVAKNDKLTNEIFKVINRDYTLLEEGQSLPFEETLCNVAIQNGTGALIIPKLSESPLTKHLAVTNGLENGCFIGIPINYKNGENFGTICGIDKVGFQFTQEHIETFQTLAALLTSAIEADRAFENIRKLSVPLVPITKGVAILPIIGDVDSERAQLILESSLQESKQLSLNHLIIDVSGVLSMDDTIAYHLLKIVDTLNLLGVKAILTGLRKEMVMSTIHSAISFKDVVIRANLEQALSHIGFELSKRSKSK